MDESALMCLGFFLFFCAAGINFPCETVKTELNHSTICLLAPFVCRTEPHNFTHAILIYGVKLSSVEYKPGRFTFRFMVWTRISFFSFLICVSFLD